VKRNPAWLSLLGSVSLLFPLQSPAQTASLLEGTWRLLSYVKADTQIRYATDGYMMFGKNHWLHVAFFNRDPREKDFSEAHHGTYEITGPDSLTLDVDMELHMDPKTEFQETPIWYGAPAHLEGAKYRQEGNRVIIDLPSTAQLVLERIE
jgi:hypothetical protein